MTTATEIANIPMLSHPEAITLQAVELDRALHLLRSLDPDQWNAPTDCPDWDVRHVYLHVLGACEAGASIRENVHQMRAGRAHRRHNGGTLEAGLSATQVREREALTPVELIDRLAAVAPIVVKKRASLPGIVRRGARMKVDGPVVETWRLGYLVDVIYLRDLWMHRIDTCRATGHEPTLTPDHDGRIVADVVAEWTRRHGQPVSLHLRGPAGGTFLTPGPGEDLDLDAIEFCRILAGRAPATRLLQTIVPF